MHVKYYGSACVSFNTAIVKYRIFVDLVGLLTRKNIIIRDWAIFIGDMGPVQNGMGGKFFIRLHVHGKPPWCGG